MPTQSRPHSAVTQFEPSLCLFLPLSFPTSSSRLSYPWVATYIKAAPVTMLGSESDERTGLAGLGWAGLGWAGRAVWWQRRQMMSCAGHWLRLLLVTIYTATPPPSIQEISGNICTVQSVISISRCLPTIFILFDDMVLQTFIFLS